MPPRPALSDAARLLLLLLLLPTSAALLSGCSSDAQSKEPEDDGVVLAVPVEAAVAEIGSISAYFTGTATLEAEEDALVVARAGGVVTRLHAEEGQYVRAGQPLVQLDDERLRLELARAEVTLQKLERAFKRSEDLHRQQLVSTEEYEQHRTEYENQKAARDLAQLSLTYTTVRAPISGVVSERLVKVGNMVSTNAPTYRITDFDPLLAVLHVPERELGKLSGGQETLLTVDALPGRTFRGRIARISPVVDPETGTFKVTVAVRPEGFPLKPGMFGRVRIVYDTRDSSVLVPKAALIREDDRSTVFVVRDSLAFRVPVVPGYEDERYVEIQSGLEVGAQVVVTGQRALRDSLLVEVLE